MSYEVEDRVVEMRFDNSDFEKNVDTSIKSLNALEDALKFEDSEQGLENVKKAINDMDFTPVQAAIETISNKFSVLEVMAITAISNITNKIVNMGEQWLKALTITPVSTGWAEYGQQLDSVQVIMANTGATLDETTKALGLLNEYADLTSYSFSDMTTAISKFSAAGVGLDDSVAAIKGLSNAAALVGASRSQLYSAYYNLAQSMQQGYMQLIDWKSIANSSIGNKQFRENLVKMAIEMGKFEENSTQANKALSDFNGSLSDRWLTKDVMVETLNRYSKTTEDYIKVVDEATGKTKYYTNDMMEVSDYWLNIGESATKAATEIKNLSGMWDVLCEAAQTGWADTWSLIVGDLDDSKELFTNIGNKISAIIEGFSDARKSMLAEWNLAQGREYLVESIYQLIDNIWSIMRPIVEAINEVFPITGKGLADVCKSLRDLLKMLELNEDQAELLKNALIKVLTPLKYLMKIVKIGFLFVQLTGLVLKTVLDVIVAILTHLEEIPKILKQIFAGTKLEEFIGSIPELLNKAKSAMLGLFVYIKDAVTNLLPKLKPILESLKDLLYSLCLLGLNIARLLSNIDWSFVIAGLNAVVKVLNLLVKGVTVALLAVSKFMETISTKLETQSTVTKKAAKTAGSNIIDGFINGIQNDSKIQKVVAATSTLGTLIVDTFKNVLGIHSPSVVFFVLGGFLIAGLIAGIVANYGVISSTMSTVGQTISDGFLSAIDTIAKSEVYKKLVVIFNKIGAVALEFMQEIKPVHVVALMIAAAVLILARSIRSLTSVFDGLNEVFEAMATRIKAQAFDTVANGLLKIAAAIAVLVGLAMIDPDRFRSAAITIGVLSASLMVLTFVLLKLDAMLSKCSLTFKETGRVLAGSSFFMSFTGAILMLTLAIKALTEMDDDNIWNSVKVLISLMTTMAVLSTAMSALAPKMARGAVFFLAFALSTRVLANTLATIRESVGNLENIKETFMELITTMTMIYAASVIVAGVLSRVVTTISKQLTTMFLSLAVAVATVSVSILIYASAMRMLSDDMAVFTDTAKECVFAMTEFVGVLAVFMTVIAAIAVLDKGKRIETVLLSMAGSIAIVAASLSLFVISIGLIKKLVTDLDDVSGALAVIIGVLAVFAAGMVALVTIIGKTSTKIVSTIAALAGDKKNKDAIDAIVKVYDAGVKAFAELIKQFSLMILAITGAIVVLTAGMALMKKFEINGAILGVAVLILTHFLSMIGGLILLAGKVCKNKDALSALKDFMSQVVALFSLIFGGLVTIAAMMAIEPKLIGGIIGATIVMSAIGGMIVGLLAIMGYVAKSVSGDKKQVAAIAAIMGTIVVGFLAFAAAATAMAKIDVDYNKVIISILAIGGVIAGLMWMMAGISKWVATSDKGIAGLFAASVAILALSAAISTVALAFTFAIKEMQGLDNIVQNALILGAALGAFTLIIISLMAAMYLFSETGVYGLIGAAVVLALATALITFAYAIKAIGESNALSNIATGLSDLYDKFMSNAAAVWSLFGCLVLLSIALALAAPPILVIGVACLFAGLGIAAAATAMKNFVEALTLASGPVSGLIDAVSALLDKIIEFNDAIQNGGQEIGKTMGATVTLAFSGAADTINAAGDAALKFCAVIWSVTGSLILLGIFGPLVVPVLLGIALAFSTVIISIGVVITALAILVNSGANLQLLGQQIVLMLEEVVKGVDLLYERSEAISVVNGLIAGFGGALMLVGLGLLLLGGGLLTTGIGIIAFTLGTYVAMKVWGEQIITIIEKVKEWFSNLFNDSDYMERVEKFVSKFSYMLMAMGVGLAVLGAGILLVGGGMVAMGLGILALAGALAVWYRAVGDDYVEIHNSLIQIGGALAAFSAGCLAASIIAPFMLAIAVGVLSLAGAFAVWNLAVGRKYESVKEGLCAVAYGLAAMSPWMVTAAINVINMLIVAVGLVTFSGAIALWNHVVLDCYNEIADSFIKIGEGLMQFASACAYAGMMIAMMLLSAVGVLAMSGALCVWGNTVIGLYDYEEIAESLKMISTSLMIFAAGCAVAGSFVPLMLLTAIGLLAMSGALYVWGNAIGASYDDIANGLYSIGTSLLIFGAGCMVSGAAAPGMIGTALGLVALGLALPIVAFGMESIAAVAATFPALVELVNSSTTLLGEIFTNGFVQGILDNSGLNNVMSAASALAQAAISTLAGPDGIDDPIDWSAATRWLGQVFTNGFTVGITDKVNEASDAASTLGTTATNALSNSILGNSVTSALSNGWGKVTSFASGVKDKISGIWNSDGSGGIMSLLGIDGGGITDKIKDLVGDITTAFDFNAGDNDLFGGLSNSAESAKGTIESLTDTIRNQMKMFEEFDDSTDMSAEQLLHNMESQLNGITNWANGIETLGLRGMSAELIQYLAEMGPEGYKYVEAFLDMTEDELARANSMYTESLSLPDSAAATIKTGYEAAGVQIVESVASGISSGSSSLGNSWDTDVDSTLKDEAEQTAEDLDKQATEATEMTLIDAIDQALQTTTSKEQQNVLHNVQQALIHGWTPDPAELREAWEICYKDAMSGINTSMFSYAEVYSGIAQDNLKLWDNSWINTWKNASSLVQDAMAEGWNGTTFRAEFNVGKWDANDASQMEKLGKSTATFIVDGVEMGASEYSWRCRNAGEMLGAQVIGGYQEILDINSPSKVMEQQAEYTALGLIKGLGDNASNVFKSSEDLGDEAINGLSTSLGAVSDIFGTDFDTFEPTITPILDLSNVDSGVNILNDLLNGKKTIVENLDVQSPNKMNNDAFNAQIDKLNQLNAQRNKELIDALNRVDRNVSVDVTLEGDAEGVFKLVEQQNLAATKATGVSPLMTMYNNGLTARRATN